jgi:hypothetical protein
MGTPGALTTKAGFRNFPPWHKKTVVHPARSKSIRRNSDVSPIAVLVDHENSIHTRLLCWIMAHLAQSQKSRFCHATPSFDVFALKNENADCA